MGKLFETKNQTLISLEKIRKLWWSRRKNKTDTDCAFHYSFRCSDKLDLNQILGLTQKKFM